MTSAEFEQWLLTQPVEDKIVALRCKYSHEKEWTYLNVLLIADEGGDYEWSYDWYEGEQEVEILGCESVADVNVPRFRTEHIEGSEE